MTEAVLQGSSKSTGIRLLLQHFGLCPQDAVAFGDSTNDIPMFQCVSTPIAMGGCRRSSGVPPCIPLPRCWRTESGMDCAVLDLFKLKRARRGNMALPLCER